jgi:hypothetical protein
LWVTVIPPDVTLTQPVFGPVPETSALLPALGVKMRFELLFQVNPFCTPIASNSPLMLEQIRVGPDIDGGAIIIDLEIVTPFMLN